MNRRRVLSAVGVTAVGLAGCLGNEEIEPESASTEPENTNTPEEGESCPELGTLAVSIPGSVPEDEPIVDAKREQLIENEYLAEGLETASNEYEDGMENGLDGDEEERLAEIGPSEEMASAGDILEFIEYGTTFVEYNEITYVLSYYVSIC